MMCSLCILICLSGRTPCHVRLVSLEPLLESSELGASNGVLEFTEFGVYRLCLEDSSQGFSYFKGKRVSSCEVELDHWIAVCSEPAWVWLNPLLGLTPGTLPVALISTVVVCLLAGL